MSDYWKYQDLQGDGLQTINQQYSRLKLDAGRAYLYCLLFPIGAHQFYLRQSNRVLLYIFLSTSALTCYFLIPLVMWLLVLIEIVILVFDIKNIETLVANHNKQLKMNLSLQSDAAPPQDYKGRYTEEEAPIDDYLEIKNKEITAFEKKKDPVKKSRVYSFSEQEKMLKQMKKKK